MISISDRYVQLIYRRMHQKMLESRLIHCDETPFKLIAPDKGPNSKAYMWVYHTMEVYGSHPLFLYEYQDGRSADMPREFLKDYKGVLVTMDIRYITSLPVNDRMNFGLQAAGHIANGSLTMF